MERLHKNAKINPNIIWQTRTRIKGQNELDYDLIPEEGEKITNPEEAKEYIATYFENLYQARPSTEEYQKWTEEISSKVEELTNEYQNAEKGNEDFSINEINKAIKMLKRNKSQGPNDIPNKKFIESDIDSS